MEFNFGSEYYFEMMSNAFWLPLFSHVEKMERFSMDAVSNTVAGVFRKFGMYEMSKLTGLEMMDYVRDMIMEIPRGLKIQKGEFKFTTTEDDLNVYCENGNI